MRSPRWRKLAGDLRATWGRLLAAQIAIAFALAGVGVALGARAVIGREMRASYAGTHPLPACYRYREFEMIQGRSPYSFEVPRMVGAHHGSTRRL